MVACFLKFTGSVTFLSCTGTFSFVSVTILILLQEVSTKYDALSWKGALTGWFQGFMFPSLL